MNSLSTSQVLAALQRLQITHPIAVDLQSLKKLHRAHLAEVPFETLDLYAGKSFSLNLPELYDKIVVRKRGGYCYELNGFFCHLLRALGFEVFVCNALLFNEKRALIPDSKHMVLVVRLEQDWLIDIGYGNGFTEPLSLNEPNIQEQGRRAFRCTSEYTVKEKIHGAYIPWYTFVKQDLRVEDFEDRNRFHQTDKRSVFFRKRICMIAREEEQIELSGNRLTRQTPTGTLVSTVEEENIPNLLQTAFGIPSC